MRLLIVGRNDEVNKHLLLLSYSASVMLASPNQHQTNSMHKLTSKTASNKVYCSHDSQLLLLYVK